MKKIFLLFILLLSVSTMITAQRPQGGQGGQRMTVEERAKQTTKWMESELKLTKNQVAPVDSINLVFAKAQQALFQSAEGDREKIREAMTALEKEKETAFSKVLTPEQLETYKEKVKELMNRRRGEGGGNRSPRGGNGG